MLKVSVIITNILTDDTKNLHSKSNFLLQGTITKYNVVGDSTSIKLTTVLQTNVYNSELVYAFDLFCDKKYFR